MAKIYAPNKSYNGICASVNFINGAGETNDKYLISWFKAHGYKTEETKPKAVEEIEEETEEAPKKGRRRGE